MPINGFEDSKEEKKILIPKNPYKPKNPDEFPILENIEQPKRGGRGRRYKNFRASSERISEKSSEFAYSDKSSEKELEKPPDSSFDKIIPVSPVEPSETVEKNWPTFAKETSELQIAEEFNLKTHKTQKCTTGDKCKGCNKYHYEGEKRRDPELVQYLPVLCNRAQNCVGKDRCGKAHNLMELYYHPQLFKSHPCPYTIKYKQCSFGHFCNFIHLFEQNVQNKAKPICKNCFAEDVCIARLGCGHTFCKNCGVGEVCKKCGNKGEFLKIEL